MCISYHGNLCNYWHCPGQLSPFYNAHFLSRGWENHLHKRLISILQALSMRLQRFLYLTLPAIWAQRSSIHSKSLGGPWAPGVPTCRFAGVSLATTPFRTCYPFTLQLDSEPHMAGAMEILPPWALCPGPWSLLSSLFGAKTVGLPLIDPSLHPSLHPSVDYLLTTCQVRGILRWIGHGFCPQGTYSLMDEANASDFIHEHTKFTAYGRFRVNHFIPIPIGQIPSSPSHYLQPLVEMPPGMHM